MSAGLMANLPPHIVLVIVIRPEGAKLARMK